MSADDDPRVAEILDRMMVDPDLSRDNVQSYLVEAYAKGATDVTFAMDGMEGFDGD